MFRALILVVGLAMAAIACGDEEPELTLPATTPSTTTTGSTEERADEPTTTDTEATDSTADDTEPGDDGAFTPTTVQFDPEDPPDQATLNRLVLEAVEAEFFNALWCWENTTTCDLDSHVGPSITASRRAALQADFERSFPDGTGNYTPGAGDGVVEVEVSAFADQEFNLDDDRFRLVGAVVTCDIYVGTYNYPDADDVNLNVGQLAEYRVWQEDTGVLKVAQQSITEQGEAELCEVLAES